MTYFFMLVFVFLTLYIGMQTKAHTAFSYFFGGMRQFRRWYKVTFQTVLTLYALLGTFFFHNIW
jgi:hypothetical protein